MSSLELFVCHMELVILEKNIRVELVILEK